MEPVLDVQDYDLLLRLFSAVSGLLEALFIPSVVVLKLFAPGA